MSFHRRDHSSSPSYRYHIDGRLEEILRAPRFRQRDRSDIDWSDIDFPDTSYDRFPVALTPPPEPAPRLRQQLLRAASLWLLTAVAYLVFYLVAKQCLEKLGTLLVLGWHDSLRQLDAWAASKLQASYTRTNYYRLHYYLQRTWSLLSHTLPPLLCKAYTVTSRLAAPTLHRYHAALPQLLQKTLTNLPSLLHGARATAIARAAQILHHARSATGTPAYYYRLHPYLQRTWLFLSHTLPPLMCKAYTTTSRLAALILHRYQVALPQLLHTSQKTLTTLPSLLNETRAAAIARATQILHHVRSATGTPACPSAECLRIAARTTRLVASARELAITAFAVGSVVAVLLATKYAHWWLTRLVRWLVRMVLLGEKWSSSSGGSSSSSSSSSGSSSAAGVGASRTITVSGDIVQSVQNMESLRERAESASLLLEVFSRTVCDCYGVVEKEQRDMVAAALKDVVGIGKELGIEEVQASAGGGGGGAEAAQAAGGLGGEGVCVVCYDAVADMVVLPCRHLALCVTCCDGMSIRECNSAGYGNAKCPICRTTVMDRMKIFRS